MGHFSQVLAGGQSRPKGTQLLLCSRARNRAPDGQGLTASGSVPVHLLWTGCLCPPKIHMLKACPQCDLERGLWEGNRFRSSSDSRISMVGLLSLQEEALTACCLSAMCSHQNPALLAP